MQLDQAGKVLDCSAERLGIIMEPDPGVEEERLGVLNPGVARSSGGNTYLFPRVVASGNYSRIAVARVNFDPTGRPCGVERLGIVLEPEEPWENNHETAGVEDPRITFVSCLGRYVMAYCAYGPLGPRIALATSTDLLTWKREGPVTFTWDSSLHVDLNLYTNKDAVFFPEPVTAPDGRPALALLHRPTWDLSKVNPRETQRPHAALGDPRPGIWVSYAPLPIAAASLGKRASDVEDSSPAFSVKTGNATPPLPTHFDQHRLVALPEHPWEQLKIGAGPPPVAVPEGWLFVYHGVTGRTTNVWPEKHLRYVAGVMLLDRNDVTNVLWRAEQPLLEPVGGAERDGVVPNVVFPTGIDVRAPGKAHLYYGMADSRIGVAELRWSIRDKAYSGRSAAPAVPEGLGRD